MIDMTKIMQVFTDKLATTQSLDQALHKAAWVAYKQGIQDATPPVVEVPNL